jgi:crotonobetaine/carnitine-CoA ligase
MDVVGNRTLGSVWDELVERAGGRTFLTFEAANGGRQEYTYASFAALIDQTANLLLDMGVEKGDAVVTQLSNCPELLMAFFAAGRIGAVIVPLHARSTVQECGSAVERTAARVVLCDGDSASAYGAGAESGAGCVHVPHVLVARSYEPEMFPRAMDFAAERDARPTTLVSRPPVDSDDIAAVLFTSGTTALPKGVVLTHANLVFSGLFVDWEADITSRDRLLTTMPACHVNFLLSGMMPVLMAEAQLVMIEKYSASLFWRQAVDYRATVVQSVAMILRTMLATPEHGWERQSCVREVLYYLPVTDQEKQRFEERYATRILNSYGTSETLVGAITDPPHGERRWPSIGRPGLGYEARIMGEQGEESCPGAVGEIQIRGVRGRSLMKEYFDDQAATSAAFADEGWIRTGDLGYADADGWFYFVDRRSSLIKRAGENVSPAEVESVLAGHPDIEAAAVIGVPDPVRDQAVKAFVVLRSAAALTVEQVQEYASQRLAYFKVPTIVEFVDSLPQTDTYKVAKGLLD